LAEVARPDKGPLRAYESAVGVGQRLADAGWIVLLTMFGAKRGANAY